MMKYLIFLSVLFSFGSMKAQDYWMQKDSVNGNPKSVCGSFVANGEGYIVSGLDYSGFSRKMYSYNVLQNDWDTEQSIGGANGGGLSRGSACTFAAINKGYICTGQGDNGNYLNDNWEYDPISDVWTQKADFPGSARRGATCFVIDEIAYVGTGEDASGLRKDFFKYDPVNNVWGNVIDFAGTPRKQAVGFAMGNQGYVGTGYDGAMRNDFWQFLVFQNMWVQKANFPGTPRAGATGWGIFPNGYIATGEDNNFNYTNDVWEYNYFTNQWIQRASLPAIGRKGATSFVIDGVAYLGTGYNVDHLDDFYAYYGIVGVEDQANEVSLTVYPNPVSEKLSINFGTDYNQNKVLKFYAADGREVNFGASLLANQNVIEVNVENSIPGLYYVVVCDKAGEVQITEPFVIRN